MGANEVTPEGPAGLSGQRAVRANNLATVLRTVRRLAPCSRAEVAAAAGLTKSTVSSLVAELIERRLLREGGTAAARKIGRPGLMLEIDEDSVAAVGLEVNVDYLTLVALDLTGRELFNRHVEFDARAAGPEASVSRMAELVTGALADPLLAGRGILGVGVAVPGLVDATTGTVRNAPNLGWRGVGLGASLSAAIASPEPRDIPVLVDNDATLAVLAECRDGHLAGALDLVYLTGEVGVGAGMLANGVALRGASGYGGEIGHVCLLPDGPRCACGRRGCLEALAGIEAILRRSAPDLVSDGPLSGATLARAVRVTVERASADEGDVREVLHRAGGWLGRGAAVLVNLLDPRAVILGGYFVPLGPWLVPAAETQLGEHAIVPAGEERRVHLSELGLSAAARGGAATLIQALDQGRLELPTGWPPASAAGGQ
ncbi:ROK family transcriptional regulator [Halostreptopolyspora alba]|uniref:ROK family transcriptional regulator n=1 Tax=Halostreptopolyspora alba TaxID=2487137 RepID=A0A3N0EG95_9ACTN|nr:ROK family transcriptional regulator [Nocardiopsaceae bacterium YIM 96095]